MQTKQAYEVYTRQSLTTCLYRN